MIETRRLKNVAVFYQTICLMSQGKFGDDALLYPVSRY